MEEESLSELPAEVTGDHILCTCEMCVGAAACRVYVDEFIIVSSIPIYSSNRGTAPIVYHQSSSIQNVSFDIMVLVVSVHRVNRSCFLHVPCMWCLSLMWVFECDSGHSI